MGGGCGDDHDGGSTPKVSGLEPNGNGGGHEGLGAGKLAAGGGLNSGRFGGSHAIAPMRLAGISDMKTVSGSGGAVGLAALGCAPDGGCPVPGAADDGGMNQSSGPSSVCAGTNQSSIPSGGGASWGGLG
jgi:hypothetical protein